LTKSSTVGVFPQGGACVGAGWTIGCEQQPAGKRVKRILKLSFLTLGRLADLLTPCE